MSYKIALASSDGSNIDRTFGGTEKFTIVEVTDGKYMILEERVVLPKEEDRNNAADEVSGGCTPAGSCGCGGGCGGNQAASPRVRLVSDCRCVVCKKIGGGAQKQFSKLAISTFDVECGIDEALKKITLYFDRVDKHKSLRGIAHEEKSLQSEL